MTLGDWDRVRELGSQLLVNGGLAVTEELRELLPRVAMDVALSSEDAHQALASPETAAALLREVHQRIHDGSRRLSRALVESHKLKMAGDLGAARQVLTGVASVEVVPLYLEQLQIALDHLDESEDASDTDSQDESSD
ncbi:DUSAM domain-containing protein [Corallococcus sp. ZKHCc1 1396]|uniref:DUSAM domain-containing protein n=1 Tax=Corallococcus soli TaxID=2710757 RepID=A0ABR9PYT5_9BACT|nr:DUSAM domain-containing protein [Corallococcus soli]MBE4753093.1 DUSAM domain-containing protein [Corallococcus soli]